MKILGIESSCDETAASVVEDGRIILSSVISSQIDIHKRFGGVVPEIASRNHTLAIRQVVDEALVQAGVGLDEVDAIAVTYGAGLVGALLVGVSYAKALSYATGKPLYAVNHIQGHIAANYLAHPDLEPPYLCLVASGGHTALVRVKDYTDFEVMGMSTDDACGEAFDKVARVIGLEYPGGPKIELLAREGEDVVPMPRMLKGHKGYDFSYSGLKTAVINYVHTLEQKGLEIPRENIACSFQNCAISMLVDNAVRCAKALGEKKIVVAGGVGANGYLREKLTLEADKYGIQTLYPPKHLCTDNASMIAGAGYYEVLSGRPATLDLNAVPSLNITDRY